MPPMTADAAHGTTRARGRTLAPGVALLVALACEAGPASREVALDEAPRAVVDASDAARPKVDDASYAVTRREPAAIRDASLEAALADPYPSLRHYPDGGPRLRAALAAHAGPREVLVALAEHMAPHRWPDAIDWDRHGFIDLHGARPGFVTRVAGALVPQTGGRCDLGCAGGFLEGVRLTLLPGLAIDELDRCDPEAAAVAGGPGRCDPEHEYGWLALAAIAARLAPTQLPEGPKLLEIGPTDAAGIDRLAAAGAMHLCTVSHAATAQAGARFYHHMMIVLGTPGGAALDVFDTTGARGVSLVTMTRERFFRYCTTQLAANVEFRYVSRSARLTCLAVATADARTTP